MTPVSIMRDVLDPLGLYLNQKDLKSGKKQLSLGQFPIGRLRDLNEYHTGCIGSFAAAQTPFKGHKRPQGHLKHFC